MAIGCTRNHCRFENSNFKLEKSVANFLAMTFGTLIARNLRFHARSHFGTLLGVTVGSAILIGALAVGDSVRGSLREMALARLGNTEFALASVDRFFRAKLAEELSSTT